MTNTSMAWMYCQGRPQRLDSPAPHAPLHSNVHVERARSPCCDALPGLLCSVSEQALLSQAAVGPFEASWVDCA